MVPTTYLEVRGQSLGVRAPLTPCDCYRILGSTFICWAILPAHTDIFKIVGRERERMRQLVWPEMNSYEFQTPSQRVKTLVFWRPAKLPLEETNLATEPPSSPDHWDGQEDRRQHVCAHRGCQGQQVLKGLHQLSTDGINVRSMDGEKTWVQLAPDYDGPPGTANQTGTS